MQCSGTFTNIKAQTFWLQEDGSELKSKLDKSVFNFWKTIKRYRKFFQAEDWPPCQLCGSEQLCFSNVGPYNINVILTILRSHKNAVLGYVVVQSYPMFM